MSVWDDMDVEWRYAEYLQHSTALNFSISIWPTVTKRYRKKKKKNFNLMSFQICDTQNKFLTV